MVRTRSMRSASAWATLSNTWSGVSDEDVCALAGGTAARRPNRKRETNRWRGIACSLRESEKDGQVGAEVDGRALARGGLEADLLGGALRHFVEAMSQAVHHADHANLSGGAELDFERDFAL